MRVEVFKDASSFLMRADTFLLQNEALNNLILSIASTLVQNPSYIAPFFGLAMNESGEPQAGAIWIPSRKMVMTEGSREAGKALARAARDHASSPHEALPGVLAPPEIAEGFCEDWLPFLNLKVQRGLQQSVMSMDLGPIPISRPKTPGRFRRAWLEDLPRLRSWANAMVIETHLQETPQETAEVTRRSIESRRLFVWDDGRPVAMAGHSGNTPTGARINSVYVPPELRRKGYAKAAVWSVTELLRQSGKKFVCLFADSHSPASLSLYLGLGFNEIGALNEYRFTQ